uniref:RING finger protein 207 n=1 Tax=Meloidogyne enterolobii TaxID=390850 RepID=A0A6V7W8E4_MELEN|nr:unnamed protein product [Meloidogyne enterolobii]
MVLPTPTTNVEPPQQKVGGNYFVNHSTPTNVDLIKCSLCQMLYKEPKVLACFHSFCKNCLERQIKIKETTTTPNNKPQSIICQICCQETQLNPQLGIEGLLSDYGLENAVQSLGTSTPYSEQSEDLGFGSLKSSDGWPAQQQVPDFLPSSNNNSCQQQSNNLNKVPSNVCMCLEHRQQPLVFFCQYCQHAICRECVRKHKDCKIDRIDNVSNKQIKMMEHLLNEAQIKQNGLNEMFQLINLRQNNLNASFQQAKQTIDDTFYFLIKTLHEAQKSLYKELEGAYSYNNNNLNLNKLGGGEYRLGVPDLQQAKQAIITPFNQLRAGGAWINNNQQQNNRPSMSLGTTKINCNSSSNSRNNILATSAPTNSNNGWGGNKPLVSLDCRCDRRTQDKCEC